MYYVSKREILDRLRQDLRLRCVDPLRNTQWKPSNKSRIHCNEMRNIEGNVDRILATLEDGVIKFQSGAVASIEGGCQEACGGNRASDLRSLFYAILKDLWLYAHGDYFGGLRKRKTHSGT